jgi:hypothetical protein
MNVAIAILASEDPHLVERAIKSVDSNNVDKIVICNTPDPRFIKKCETVALRNNCIFRISSCNGTPGKGKNSLLQFLRASTYDYMIAIDGDDFFYKNGINELLKIIKEHRPDVLGLINTFGKFNKKIDYLYTIENDTREIMESESILPVFNFFKKHFPLDVQSRNNFHRLVVFSKKSASLVKYDESLLAAEDMLGSLLAKKLYQEKKLSFLLHDCTGKNPIYVYDLEDIWGGAVGKYAKSNQENHVEVWLDMANSLDLTDQQVPIV